MKVMIDTNIFISAALFPNGKASAALWKALTSPYQPLTCDYVVDELHRKFREKFPDKMTEMEAFLYSALPIIHVIATPEDIVEAKYKIRAPKDRPILRAALSSNADLFLTGDKDFLESSVDDPRIISVTEFLNH